MTSIKDRTLREYSSSTGKCVDELLSILDKIDMNVRKQYNDMSEVEKTRIIWKLFEKEINYNRKTWYSDVTNVVSSIKDEMSTLTEKYYIEK